MFYLCSVNEREAMLNIAPVLGVKATEKIGISAQIVTV
jgi:hypothetical protein